MEEEEEVEPCIKILNDALLQDQTSLPLHSCPVAYRQRLATFSTLNFYAKPISLSPIVCARFGWKNVGPDMISCCHCRSVLAIIIHHNIKNSKNLEELYYEQITVSGHRDVNCPFRLVTEILLGDDDSLRDIVPMSLFNVLPFSFLEWIEHPYPRLWFRRRYGEFMNKIRSNKNDCCFGPEEWNVPHHVRTYRPSSREEENVDDNMTTAITTDKSCLFARIRRVVGLEATDTKLRDECFLAWILFGWWPQQQDTQDAASSTTPITLECPFCLAQVTWDPSYSKSGSNTTTTTTTDNNDTDTRRNKRARVVGPLDPYSRHRYYCPVVAGFVNKRTTDSSQRSAPLWQLLADSVLLWEPYKRQETTTAGAKSTTTTAIMRTPTKTAEDILKQAISPTLLNG